MVLRSVQRWANPNSRPKHYNQHGFSDTNKPATVGKETSNQTGFVGYSAWRHRLLSDNVPAGGIHDGGGRFQSDSNRNSRVHSIQVLW